MNERKPGPSVSKARLIVIPAIYGSIVLFAIGVILQLASWLIAGAHFANLTSYRVIIITSLVALFVLPVQMVGNYFRIRSVVTKR